jgi:stage V sporulation protein D (sporulation-specific penicillin-binding protein)
MNPATFYQYVNNFGFGDRTGIQLDGEQYGIVSNSENFNKVHYVTQSFGQGIGVTPIQLITALSAVVNGGQYFKPTIIKETISSETGEVIQSYLPDLSRRIISSDTAGWLKESMKNVVAESTQMSAQTQGFSIGGKTGTAQKIIDGAYSSDKYITSFFGFAPVDDPKISLLVIVDEAEHGINGGRVAASNTAGTPAVELIAKILKYMNIPTGEAVDFGQTGIVPDVRNVPFSTAKEVLGSMGLSYEVLGETVEDGIVVDQQPRPGTLLEENTKLKLTLGQSQTEPVEGTSVAVPNVLDLTVQSARILLQQQTLNMDLQGTGGFAIQQNPAPGTVVPSGSTVVVTFEHVDKPESGGAQ